jgi:hypothetical protein
MSTDEMEKYRDKDRQQEAGACIIGEARKDREEPNWKEKYNKERKLRQEAEGELSILKGIETNRVKEAQAMCDNLSLESDRIKRDNVNLYNRIAELIEVDESHQKLNGKLQERLTELEEENKKMHGVLNKRMNNIRKSGL